MGLNMKKISGNTGIQDSVSERYKKRKAVSA
jgi:hypothetical protein